MNRLINYALFAAFAGLVFIFAAKIFREGYDHGLSIKKPAVIIISPPCVEGPADKTDSLWRL